jgi:hypothetical protein
MTRRRAAVADRPAEDDIAAQEEITVTAAGRPRHPPTDTPFRRLIRGAKVAAPPLCGAADE